MFATGSNGTVREAGLHYNWHRHYEPTLGRYTQPDPLGFVDGPSVYAYAKSSPHALVDPAPCAMRSRPIMMFQASLSHGST